MDTPDESQGIGFESIADGLPQLTYQGHVPHYSEVCARCHGEFSADNGSTGDLCGDCKFLLVEDLENPVRGSNRRRTSHGRRYRYSSSESIEDLSSRRFSRTINLMRQNHFTTENEDQNVDGDGSARFLWHNSSRSSPSGSRRWRRMLSDSESDGFDYMEDESNFSFGHPRSFHGESDAISFSAYGGDSDISIDGHSFLDTDIFAQTNEESDLYSESDIDPMHAGIGQWEFGDAEEDGEEDDDDEDSESTDAEGDAMESREVSRFEVISAQSEIRGSNDQGPTSMFHGYEVSIHWRSGEGVQRNALSIFGNLFEDLPSHSGNSGDYLDERGFEELLEHLAETDGSRRGAPPASVSYVNSLPIITIAEEHLRHDGVVCAICKDILTAGTKANQLPCLHLYHPSCILPWLNSRNSCPLCRYELPTDDKDYEERKQSRTVVHMQENREQRVVAQNSTDAIEVDEEPELMLGVRGQRDEQDSNHSNNTREVRSRGRWFFIAAAPIVSLMGLALVFWLGNPLSQRSTAVAVDHLSVTTGVGHQADVLGTSSHHRENRRRWWSFFLGR